MPPRTTPTAGRLRLGLLPLRRRAASGILCMLVVVSPRTSTAAHTAAQPLSPAPVRVEGWGFEIGTLDNGRKAFRNRTYVWRKVPEALRGWKFTRFSGGVPARITVIPQADGMLFLATTPGGLRLEGWEVVPRWSFEYTDANHTRLRVFRRACRKNERVRIPQGNWTGAIVLAPRIDGKPSPPEPDFSRVPGTVVDHSPAYTGDYIGCPGIAKLNDGTLVASHSFFGKGPRRGHTRIFRSADRGRTWHPAAEIPGQWFSSLFVHRGALYLMGVGAPGSSVIIRRSLDGGRTWTTPDSPESGLLRAKGSWHAAPTPVIRWRGRVWRAMERREGRRGWPHHFRALVLSAPENADLLDAAAWKCTNALGPTKAWPREYEGWLEGNPVVTPGGNIVDILRVHSWLGGIAAMIHIDSSGKTAAFDPTRDFFHMPGAAKKFSIRRDPVGKLYWALVNPVNEKERAGRHAASIRNTLALISSPDLRNWTIRRVVLHAPDPDRRAFQYPAWIFDGPDIIAVCRTAFDDGLGGAHNAHDANFLTFHRIRNFREPVEAPRPRPPR